MSCNFEVSVMPVSEIIVESHSPGSGYFKDRYVWPLIWYVLMWLLVVYSLVHYMCR